MWYFKPSNFLFSEKHLFSHSRGHQKVIYMSICAALNMLTSFTRCNRLCSALWVSVREMTANMYV